MGAAKAIGGLLALVGGILALLVPLDWLLGLNIFNYLSAGGIATGVIWALAGDIYWYIGLILAVIVVLGALIGMAGKKIGGALTLLVGLLWLLGGIIWTSVPQIAPVSGLLFWTDQIIIQAGLFDVYIISFEAILALFGGLLILVSSSEN